MSEEGFETIAQMKLRHLPNDAELMIQRQKGSMIPDDKVQFGLPSTFVNQDNGQTVWNRGPSIQLEQIPELIQMLQKAYEKYSKKKYSDAKSERTHTFADIYEND